jgi:crotonobetainyl-CoA:carnitine CoA-transferase CaiB-like acyl-CoA transferase
MARDSTPPLAGLTVLSLAEQYPGPFATLVLADLGARVVLVERPTGDPSRANPAFFESLNRNKLSVSLDLRSDAGREAFLALVRRADAVLEGFRPGVMARLGLGYEELSSVNPALVYVSITGFGQTGPYASLPGHDLSFQALAGMLHDRLQPGGTASVPWLSLANLASGAFAAMGVLAGLVSRTRTGRGVYVDLAMLDTLVSMLTAHLTPLLHGVAGPHVSAEPGYGLFRTADDRLIALSIYGEDEFWRRLSSAIGLVDEARLTASERSTREPELRRLVEDAIAARSYDEWAAVFGAEGLPFAPVNDLEAVLVDPQLAQRGMFVDIPTDDGQTKRFVSQPLRFADMETAPRSPAPTLGADTAAVLAEAGCSAELIRQAIAASAAGGSP